MARFRASNLAALQTFAQAIPTAEFACAEF